MTSQDLATLALREILVLDAIQTIAAEDAQDAHDKLNLLVDSWGLERPWLYTRGRITKTLAIGTQTYTIGTGASINTPRPDFDPDRAGLIIDTTATTPTELPIEVLTAQRYEAIVQKTLRSTLVRGVYYDHGFDASGFGLIYPWPIPSIGTTQLVLYLPVTAVTEFATITTDYTFPRGYRRALYSNLAIELAPAYGATVSSETRDKARESLELVKRANLRTPEMRCDEVTALASGGLYGFDYRIGDVR